jgi:putative spermidine/putrescine transport system permease protein
MLGMATALGLLYLLAPIIVVIATAFGDSPYPLFPPPGFTLRWFTKVWNTQAFHDAALVSAKLGLVSALLATVIGTFSAIALSRLRFRGRAFVAVVLLSPIVFPSIILGLALLVAFHRVGLAQTFAGMVAGHTVLVTPFVIRLVMASYAEFDPAVEEAARNLGAGWWRILFRITLPLIRPGVLAGAVFAFIISFDEVVITLFLAGPGLQTLPIRIFTYVEYSSDATVSAISTIVMATWFIVGVPIYVRFLAARPK